MEKEFSIPEGVDVQVEGKLVKVSGEKGNIERMFKYFHDIKIESKDDKVVITSKTDKRKAKAMTGTIRAHIKNMIEGVSEGYVKKMKVIYSHFPMSIKVEGDKVLITNFIGEKLPRIAKVVGDAKVDVKGQDIEVSGLNKEDVGQTCANIEQACRITKFDRRIFQDGIYSVSD